MLVAGGFCYRMLLDESHIARESQNSPAPARASDRLLSIWRFLVAKPSFCLPPHVVVCEGVCGAGEAVCGEGLHGLLGEPEVFP